MLLLIVFFSAPLSHAGEKDTTTILLFGDSIIAGYGLKTAESVPVRLQEILQKEYDVQVINGGVSGDTSGAGRGRLAWTLDKYQPDIVILALGGNDVLRGIPPHITQENIMAMLALLKEQNVTTVLSAVQAPDNLGIEYREKFNSIYTQAAEQYDVESYPFLISDTFGNKKLMQSDAIHPNAPGAALIAKKLASFLKKFL
jgi:acyl-CoA thioesterase-1